MDEVLPAVRHAVELAEECASTHEEPVFDPPASLETPGDVIAALAYAVWRARQRNPRGPTTIRLGTRTDKPPRAAKGRVNTHPIAVLGSVILCPGATFAEIASTHPFVMGAMRRVGAGRAGGQPDTAARKSARHWLHEARQQEEHGYTVEVVDGRYYYYHRPPGAGG